VSIAILFGHHFLFSVESVGLFFEAPLSPLFFTLPLVEDEAVIGPRDDYEADVDV
jgi:hypothetical protein